MACTQQFSAQPETTIRPASVHRVRSPSMNPFGGDSNLHSVMMFLDTMIPKREVFKWQCIRNNMVCLFKKMLKWFSRLHWSWIRLPARCHRLLVGLKHGIGDESSRDAPSAKVATIETLNSFLGWFDGIEFDVNFTLGRELSVKAVGRQERKDKPVILFQPWSPQRDHTCLHTPQPLPRRVPCPNRVLFLWKEVQAWVRKIPTVGEMCSLLRIEHVIE